MNIRFHTSEIKSMELFLDSIEENIIKSGFSFMLIIDNAKNYDLKKLVYDIKNHFDIFILLETDIPGELSSVDKYFFQGFHGVYYNEKNSLSDNDIKILKHSTELFPKGSLFLEYSGNELNEVDKILELNFIPVLKSCDIKLLEHTKGRIEKSKKLSRYLKYVPLLEQIKCDYNFGHKLKIKMMLETDNLRQKLMIKNVEESFNSSGL